MPNPARWREGASTSWQDKPSCIFSLSRIYFGRLHVFRHRITLCFPFLRFLLSSPHITDCNETPPNAFPSRRRPPPRLHANTTFCEIHQPEGRGRGRPNERTNERTINERATLSILHFLRAALRQNWQCHSLSQTTTTQPNRETMAIFCPGSSLSLFLRYKTLNEDGGGDDGGGWIDSPMREGTSLPKGPLMLLTTAARRGAPTPNPLSGSRDAK